MTTRIAFSLDRRTVNEDTSTVIGVKFRQDEAATIPTSIMYRIDDLNTGAILHDWSSISPASEVSITVTPAQNAIQNDFHGYETRQLLIAADYALDSQYVDAITWNVRNLSGVQ